MNWRPLLLWSAILVGCAAVWAVIVAALVAVLT